MERAFITGRGLVTPLGNSLAANEAALRSGKSGISVIQEFIDYGLDCEVGGMPDETPSLINIDRKKLRHCPPVAAAGGRRLAAGRGRRAAGLVH